jgi:hypothetical protein
MNARIASPFRVTILAACLLSAAGAHAGSFTLDIPPNAPKTYTFPQCGSFTWNGSTLTCNTDGTPPPPPPPPPTPPTPPSTPYAGCPAGSLMIDAPWGGTAISTFDFGYFSTQILAVKVVVPAGASGLQTRTTSWAEYGSGPTVREAVFSTRPCDFSTEYALKTGTGAPAKVQDVVSFSFKYTLGPPTPFAVHLDPGATYYMNIRNRFSDGSLSCFTQACSMRGGFPQ